MFEFDTIELLGLIAGTLTTSSFVPQVYKSWKTKDVEGLSLTMYTVFITGIILWLIYGVYVESLAIIVVNIITAILVMILIGLKLKHGNKK